MLRLIVVLVTLCAVLSLPTEAKQAKMAAEPLAAYDLSGDGFLTVDEVQVALGKPGRPASKEAAEALMKKVDTDHDHKISTEKSSSASGSAGCRSGN